jgi:hypothetical protein
LTCRKADRFLHCYFPQDCSSVTNMSKRINYVNRLYCTLYCTVYCVLCTVYCVLFTVYCVLCTVYCVLCTVYCRAANYCRTSDNVRLNLANVRAKVILIGHWSDHKKNCHIHFFAVITSDCKFTQLSFSHFSIKFTRRSSI